MNNQQLPEWMMTDEQLVRQFKENDAHAPVKDSERWQAARRALLELSDRAKVAKRVGDIK